MILNRKAVTTVQAILLTVGIIVVIAIAAFALGSTPVAPANKDITVYIDSVKQTGNYTQPQTSNWGTISALNTYTKNYTVTNTGTQAYNLLLLTTEPAGTTQTWAFNNTVIAPSSFSAGTLTLTLSATPAGGAYTWRLIASNGSVTQPTPTPDPSATPAPVTYQVALSAPIDGMNNFNITVNADKFTFTSATLPNTLYYQGGSTLTFRTEAAVGYSFNYWSVNGVPTAGGINPYIVNDAVGNFTITPAFMLNSIS